MLVDTGLEAMPGASYIGGVAATTRILVDYTRAQLQGHRVLKPKEGTYCERVREGRKEVNLRVQDAQLLH